MSEKDIGLKKKIALFEKDRVIIQPQAGTVSAINNGSKHRRSDIVYPIRKETNKEKSKKDKAEYIKKLLEEGQLNNRQIAEKVGCNPSVVSRINSGITYKDQNRSYPIRK